MCNTPFCAGFVVHSLSVSLGEKVIPWVVPSPCIPYDVDNLGITVRHYSPLPGITSLCNSALCASFLGCFSLYSHTLRYQRCENYQHPEVHTGKRQHPEVHTGKRQHPEVHNGAHSPIPRYTPVHILIPRLTTVRGFTHPKVNNGEKFTHPEVPNGAHYPP